MHDGEKEKDLLLLFFVLIYTYFYSGLLEGIIKMESEIEKEETTTESSNVSNDAVDKFSTINAFLKSEAIIIALATGVVYFCIYSYQNGYFNYFGIPIKFLSL